MAEAEAPVATAAGSEVASPPPQTVDPDAAFIAGAEEPEEAAEPEAEKPEIEAAAEPEPEPEAKAEPDEDWRDKRLHKLVGVRNEQAARIAALEAQLARLAPPSAQEGSPDPQERTYTAAEVNELAQQRAAEMARTQAFNASCNTAYDKGVKEFPDFTKALDTFTLLGGLPPSLVEAALEAGDAHKVLYQLGKNPNEAARIMELSPVRMAAAVAKLASKPAAAPAQPAVSKAPAPIKPITGAKGTVDLDPDKMTTEQWMKAHDAGKIH